MEENISSDLRFGEGSDFNLVMSDNISNYTMEEAPIGLSPFVLISSVGITTVAAVFGTFGNLLLLLVVTTNKDIMVVDRILVTNLAFSDLFVTVLADPVSVIAKLRGQQYLEGIPGLCHIVAIICTISCVSSQLTICCMSANRYFYICRKNIYRSIFTNRNVIIMCMSFYCVGAGLILMNVAGIGDHNFDPKSYICIWDRQASFSYTVTFTVTLVWFPTIVTGLCYLKIHLFIVGHKKKLPNQGNLNNNVAPPPTPNPRTISLAPTLFTIYAVFAMCWVPYALLIVVDMADKFPHEVYVYITTWAHLHPSLNWIVFYLTNKHFSDAYKAYFRKLFGCCMSRKHAYAQDAVTGIASRSVDILVSTIASTEGIFGKEGLENIATKQ